MVPTNATIRVITGTRTKPIGHVTLDVILTKHVLQVCFYVLPVGTMEEHVILGCTWCYFTNCQIDWHKQQAKMVYKVHATQVPLLQEGTSMQSPTSRSGDSSMQKSKGKQTLAQDTLSPKTSLSPNPTLTTSTTQPRQRITP